MKTIKLEKITENTLIIEILADRNLRRILRENKIPCAGCSYARHEGLLNIGKISAHYKINTQKLVDELNGYLQNRKKYSFLESIKKRISYYLRN